ncbi:serine hydrolase [Mucilaginibacter rubeus]|uniref:Serine hydrolase n=1 Tax=Mucilaginibacter rubeus TaxID=2027860 RepID=A0AAE6MHY4_9SPHI|nr:MULTISPECIES: serine hydrolase domain-containing protein [Mucilaginibacter]QEM03709.1 serine hydrolase [Mucilaginibacter rubeus]QEM16320.1 serine hydrolase [Mucilaginibacter gossypii]QTE40917.1 serine hydrolase [Mucilaginibacter rubeus]QTE47520.1 serine hydrolase [Mucilaginibacter rubeus]QTE58912.1 serine hydrolase [Mucilaginibacter rubeus]
MKRLTFSVLLLLTFGRVSSQSLNDAYIDKVVSRLMDTAAVTGLQIGIVKDGQVFFAKGYGYRNKALNLRNDANTCFYGASLSKSLFAYVVMQLVDEKKIDLDKPVYQYLPKRLPEYEAYKQLAGDERYKLITPRMCLDHTTGFPNWRDLNQGRLEIQFRPGTKYAYSGEGIMLLQLVVETVNGKSLAETARQRIFKPFGMDRTDFKWQPRFETNYAVGHNVNEDTLTMVRYRATYAAGSMETTAVDYTRFMAMVLQSKNLSKKSWNEMLSPQTIIKSARQFDPGDTSRIIENRSIGLSYGLGWGLFHTPKGKAFFKEGHADGWMHYVIGLPDQRFALVIMGNSSNAESIFKELVEKLAGVTIPWYWEGYTPYRPNIKLPLADLKKYVGEYDGRLKAIITIENGCLSVASPTVNLAKSRLYATGNDHFYLKVMEVDLSFVKDAQGKVVKVIADDEGEHYELSKIK